MKGTFLAVSAAGALLIASGTAGAALRFDAAEGCQAFNPAQPTCSYTATHRGGSPVSGISGVGSWVVKIKVGKKIEVVKSPASGEPTVVEKVFEEGTKVSVTTLAPGSGVVVGHVD
jgi:hypothetical protein